MPAKCARCGAKISNASRLASTNSKGWCHACEEEVKMFDQVVAQGGIFWRCENCGYEGTIRKSEYTDAVRKVMRISAPKPCGMTFKSCSQHQGT